MPEASLWMLNIPLLLKPPEAVKEHVLLTVSDADIAVKEHVLLTVSDADVSMVRSLQSATELIIG